MVARTGPSKKPASSGEAATSTSGGSAATQAANSSGKFRPAGRLQSPVQSLQKSLKPPKVAPTRLAAERSNSRTGSPVRRAGGVWLASHCQPECPRHSCR